MPKEGEGMLMTDPLHNIIHLKQELDQKMKECYEIAKKINVCIDLLVKDEEKDS